MKAERIYLYENNENVYLDIYLCNMEEMSILERPLILICPGGAYSYCSPREAEPIARSYMARGYHAAVLNYSVKKNTECLYDAEKDVTKPHFEVAKSICIIRDNAKNWSVSPDKIAVIGFSAGGHLAACASILFNDEKLLKALGCEVGYNKPNASLLCYPVITTGEYAHKGSIENLLGEYATEENLTRYSLEKSVTKNTPPTFLVHATRDPGVPAMNSIDLASAFFKAGVNFELHIIPVAMHGFSTAQREVLPHHNPYITR